MDDPTDPVYSEITTPSFFLVGNADLNTPAATIVAAYRAVSTSNGMKYLAIPEDAAHDSFRNACEAALSYGVHALSYPNPSLSRFLIEDLATRFESEGCDSGDTRSLIDTDVGRWLQQHYAVSFFKKYVAGDRSYSSRLTLGYANSSLIDDLRDELNKPEANVVLQFFTSENASAVIDADPGVVPAGNDVHFLDMIQATPVE